MSGDMSLDHTSRDNQRALDYYRNVPEFIGEPRLDHPLEPHSPSANDFKNLNKVDQKRGSLQK